MIRAANHSSYPRVGESLLTQQLRTVLHARDRGEATDEDVASVADEVAAVVVAEQARAFIDVVTDGMVRWEGPLSHVARHLEGMAARDLVRWFDTNFYDRRPEAIGPVRRRGPFLVRDWRMATAVSDRPVKVVLPGPVTFARLSKDRFYGALAPFARAVAEALAQEATDLAAAGARVFQLDEPLLCRHPEDLDLVAETASTIFAAAGAAATTIVSTYFGDLTPLAGRLDRIPGTHLGLDLVDSSASWDLLAHLPDGRGAVLGLFDARTTRQEDAGAVGSLLDPWRETLMRRDVLVGPQAGLELLPRDNAFDKLLHARYLVERLRKDWRWTS